MVLHADLPFSPKIGFFVLPSALSALREGERGGGTEQSSGFIFISGEHPYHGERNLLKELKQGSGQVG